MCYNNIVTLRYYIYNIYVICICYVTYNKYIQINKFMLIRYLSILNNIFE